MWMQMEDIWVFPKYFQWIQWQKYFSLKEIQPATSYVRDQDATTAPAVWETFDRRNL